MKYLLFCLLYIPTFLSAQCYGSFELFGAAGLSDMPYSLTDNIIDSKPVFVSRFGFGASFRIGQRSYLRTSMQFSQYGDYRSYDLQNGVLSGPDDVSHYEQTNRYLYVEGLVAYRYQFRTWSAWQPFIEAGAAVGKYGTTAFETVIHGGVAGGQIDSGAQGQDYIRSVGIIGRVGFGSNYNFSERVGVYGMAVLQRHLTDLNTDSPARSYPWQATLELGVRVFVDPR